MQFKKVIFYLAITILLVSIAPCFALNEYNYTDNVAASQNPPGGLSVSQVPMFVTIGFDDNAYSGYDGSGGTGGIKWLVDYLKTKTNPAGTGNSATYDATSAKITFYFAAIYMGTWMSESPTYVKKAWRSTLEAGYECGNHTYSHPSGSAYSVSQWENEMQQCLDWLKKPFDPNEISHSPDPTKGIGATDSQIFGFRTPYLEYNSNTFTALKNKGFWYDCSIEEGWQPEHDGTNYNWPYTLNNGSPGHDVIVEWGSKQPITPSPGLWELPCHPVIAPPDSECAKYGIPTGFRDKLASYYTWWDKTSGKVTGLDYNMWYQFKMTKAEFVATLKYTLDQRLKGNRCPMMFGAHSDEYSSKWTCPNATAAERQQAIEEFINYALTKPEVRVVTNKQILDWIRNPVALGSTATGINVTFQPQPSSTITKGTSFQITARLSAVSNCSSVSATISVPNNFSITGNATQNVGSVTVGSPSNVSWTVTSTDYGSGQVKVVVNYTSGSSSGTSEISANISVPYIDTFEDFEVYTSTDLVNTWEPNSDKIAKDTSAPQLTDITVTLDQTIKHNGNKSMKVVYNIISDIANNKYGWASVTNYFPVEDWNTVSHISVWLYPSTTQQVTICVETNDPTNMQNGGVTPFEYTYSATNPGAWVEVKVSTNNLVKPTHLTTGTSFYNPTKVTGLGINPVSGSGTYYVDDISLFYVTGSSTGTPTNNPPTINITNPSLGVTVSSNVTITAQASDTDGTISKVEFYIDDSLKNTDTSSPYSWLWDTTQVTNAQHTIKVVATDDKGATGTQIITVTVNNTPKIPPTVNITNPINNMVVFSTINIQANAIETDGTISKVDFYVDNVLKFTDTGAPYSWSWNTTQSTDGQHIIRVVATDNDSLTGQSTITVIVSNIVNPAPNVTFTDPSNGEIISGNKTVTVNVTDDDAITKVEFYMDNNLVNTDNSSPYNWLWDTTLQTNSTHTVKAVAYDLETATGSAQINVIVNNISANQPPQVNITNPTVNAIVSGNMTITVNATDSDGTITKVEFYINNELKDTDTASSYTWYNWIWNTTLYANGTHAIKVVAIDNKGTATSQIINVTVTNVIDNPPTITFTNLINLQTVTGVILVSVNATDDNGVQYVEFRLSGTVKNRDTTQPFTWEWDTTQVTNGEYILKALVRDTANQQSEKEITVIVNNATTPNTIEIKPKITISSATSQLSFGANTRRAAIYDSRGNVVRDNVGNTVFDPTLDNSGRKIKSGVYIYQYETDDGKIRTGTILMIK